MAPRARHVPAARRCSPRSGSTDRWASPASLRDHLGSPEWTPFDHNVLPAGILPSSHSTDLGDLVTPLAESLSQEDLYSGTRLGIARALVTQCLPWHHCLSHFIRHICSHCRNTASFLERFAQGIVEQFELTHSTQDTHEEVVASTTKRVQEVTRNIQHLSDSVNERLARSDAQVCELRSTIASLHTVCRRLHDQQALAASRLLHVEQDMRQLHARLDLLSTAWERTAHNESAQALDSIGSLPDPDQGSSEFPDRLLESLGTLDEPTSQRGRSPAASPPDDPALPYPERIHRAQQRATSRGIKY